MLVTWDSQSRANDMKMNSGQLAAVLAVFLWTTPSSAFSSLSGPVQITQGSHRVLSRQIYLRKYLAADTAEIQTAEQSGYRTTSSKVIVIGGSGRVGGSTVRALRQLAGPDVELLVGGRSEENFLKSIERWRTLPGASQGYDYSDVSFSQLDLSDPISLENAIRGCDLVVHTAGPFQRKNSAEVLEAAIQAKVPYVDVCDDARLAMVAKGLSSKAEEAGVAATISAGIWPGIDQLMAVEACDLLGGPDRVESVDFSAFTAGTGNAGTTILSATFLILCEKVLGFKNGQRVFHAPASDFRKVNFGDSIGEKTVFRMNLIESFTCNQVLDIPNISTYFGTSPEPWNYLLKGMTLLPESIMGNRDMMQALAEFSEPLVRLTDKLVGATNSMRVEAVAKDGRKAVLKYAHEDLEVCVGIATAAFAAATLRGDVLQRTVESAAISPEALSYLKDQGYYGARTLEVRPGVWFPEEAFDDRTKRMILFDQATAGAFMWEKQIEERILRP